MYMYYVITIMNSHKIQKITAQHGAYDMAGRRGAHW